METQNTQQATKTETFIKGIRAANQMHAEQQNNTAAMMFAVPASQRMAIDALFTLFKKEGN